MVKEPYRDGFRPKLRQGQPLQKRFFRAVVMLSPEQSAWLAENAKGDGVSASAIVRKLIDDEMEVF